MANEFRHNTVGNELTQAEFEDVGLHIINNQATGDLVYASSATQLGRLPIGGANSVVMSVGGVPAYTPIPNQPGRLVAFQSFGPGSGTYTKNTSATSIMVEGIGGGGGGGGANANNAGIGAGGGGSGAYFRRFIASPNDTYAYVVGAGGARGANTGATGSPGANTTFDAAGAQNLVAPGGAGGIGGNLTGNATVKLSPGGAGGVRATGNNTIDGDFFCAGAPGDKGFSGSRTSSVGGFGGSIHGGGGGGGNANAANTNAPGNAGASPGAGGGGGAASGNAAPGLQNNYGGNGFGGILIVWEFA